MNVKRLKKAMEDAGYNQRTLAEAAGTTQVSVCRYIKQERIPSTENLYRISRVLGVTMDYLMEEGDDE